MGPQPAMQARGSEGPGRAIDEDILTALERPKARGDPCLTTHLLHAKIATIRRIFAHEESGYYVIACAL